MNLILDRREFYSTMFRLAIPIAMQSLVASSLNMVDTLMIGQLGQSELAAVGLANQIFFLLMLFLFGTNSGAAIFTAQYWGQKDIPNIRRVTGLTIITGGVVALFFSVVVLLFPAQLLRLFMDNTVVVQLGEEYLQIVAFSYVFTAISFAYSNQSRSVENAVLPMTVSGISLLCNTFLNYVFITGHFGFPALGVKGAAIATLIARVLEMVLLLFLIYRSNHLLAARWSELFDLSAAFIKRFFQTCYTVILNELFWALGVMMCNAAYARMGEQAYAAVQMTLPIQNISFVLFHGMSSACAVMLGAQIGASQDEKAFLCAKKFAVLGPALALLVGTGIIAMSSWLLSGYNVPDNIKTDAEKILIVFAFFLAAKVFNLINIVGILRSGGDTRFTLLLDSGGIWTIAVPLAFLGGLVWKLPIYQVVALVSLEEIFKIIFGLKRLYSKKWVRNIVARTNLGL
ncbi:MAG: MATE family efflux transporter [Firmicutes bacterium]|nr:MATE family efflux transporter [Bacillota bacterium]